VSVTLSPPIRIFAFVGVLAAVGLAAFLFLLLRPAADDTTAARTIAKPAAAKKAAPQPPVQRAAPRKAKLPGLGFPLPIRHALRRNRVVVVAVYLPGGSVDAFVRRGARAGAHSARAGYVAVSALSERLVRPLVAKTGVLPDPAVLVLRRPGGVTASLGVTDRQTVAQAVAQARR